MAARGILDHHIEKALHPALLIWKSFASFSEISELMIADDTVSTSTSKVFASTSRAFAMATKVFKLRNLITALDITQVLG